MKLSPVLFSTLSLLSGGATLSTTELFEHPLLWISRSALRVRLGRLEALKLVTRARGRGRQADRWTITARGILALGAAAKAAKRAA